MRFGTWALPPKSKNREPSLQQQGAEIRLTARPKRSELATQTTSMLRRLRLLAKHHAAIVVVNAASLSARI